MSSTPTSYTDMGLARPDGPDINHGTDFLIGCWALTGIVCLVLLFRYSVKAWMYWTLPRVSTPKYIWCFDDLFYLFGFVLDLGHMATIWKSWKWGLGRHYVYLTPLERTQAMRWAFISQPLAVAAGVCSRTGVVVFLHSCLAQNTKRIKHVMIVCSLVQIVVNLLTVLQIVLQCGPSPYRATNRAAYFHYVWDQLPETGTVTCQPPMVQVAIGYVQGAFNSIVDFVLAYLAAFGIWQILFRISRTGPEMSWVQRLQRLDNRVRRQRIWQSILLCGPLLLSGAASIVKTYLLSAVGSRVDFTWNIVPFILWVKIENSSIPISTCGPILRLFTRTFMDRYRDAPPYVENSGARSRHNSCALELTERSVKTNKDSRGFTRMSERKEILEHRLGEKIPVDSDLDFSREVVWSSSSRAVVKCDFE